MNLVVWGGGTVDELERVAAAAGVRVVVAYREGEALLLAVGAPAFVNAAFREAFPSRHVPSGTVLVLRVDSVSGDGPDGPRPTSLDLTRGEFDRPLTSGLNFVVWGGGAMEELETTAAASGVDALVVWVDGDPILLAVGAPAFAQARFREAFPSGDIASGTIFALRVAPPGGG